MGMNVPVADSPRRFFISCMRCRRPIMLVEHVCDIDLGRLRAHILDHNADMTLPGAAKTLRQFRIEPEPGPPDAA
jgi:hypothetical protein